MHCQQLSLRGGGQMQFHMGRQLRFHLNLIRVLSAAHSRHRSREECLQQIESKCCKRALLSFAPGSCITFMHFFLQLHGFLAAHRIPSSLLKCSLSSPKTATFTRTVSLRLLQVLQPFWRFRESQPFLSHTSAAKARLCH